jgi:hypothetical protein
MKVKFRDGAELVLLLEEKTAIDKALAVEIAIACAEHVLPKPKTVNFKAHRAVEAAKRWLANPTPRNAKMARDCGFSSVPSLYPDPSAFYAADAAGAPDADKAIVLAANGVYCGMNRGGVGEKRWQIRKVLEIVRRIDPAIDVKLKHNLPKEFEQSPEKAWLDSD